MSFQSKVFDLEDLKRLIFSFGSVEHRQHMIRLCEELNYKTSTYLLSDVPKMYKNDIRITQHLHVENLVLDKLNSFYKLKKCHCCSRHCHRKPNILYEEVGFIFQHGDERVPEDHNYGDCRCECRHRMRVHMDYIQVMIGYDE